MKREDKRSLWSFSLASFFNDMGSDMIAPVWPLFLTTVLGGSVALLGFIDGLAVAIVSLSTALAGWWSDKVGKRKPFIAVGYLFSSLSRIGYYLSTIAWHVIPFKVLDRFGKIRESPRDAMIFKITTKSERGKSFGFLRSMDSFGAVVGTLITLLIINYVGIRKVMLLAVIPSMLSILVILFFVKDVKGRHVFKGFSLKVGVKLKRFLILMCLFTFFSMTYSFLIVFASDNGFDTTGTILLYLLLNVVYTLGAYQFGRLSDRLGRFKLMITGLLLFALTCVSAFFSQVILMFLFFALYLAVFDPVQKTIVAELAPTGRKGGIIGSYQAIIGLIAIPGGLFMGFLYDLNALYPFIIGLFNSLLIAFLMKKVYK